MLHRMKPLPRAMIIIALVGGIGFALSKIDFSALTAKKTETPVAGAVEAPTVTTVTPGQPPATTVQAPTAPATPAAPEAPVALQPAQSNSGLDAVLNAGRK